MLEPRSGLSDEEVDRCCRVGLQFVPGLYPRVYAVDSGSLRLADAAERGRLLVAVQAISELCRRDLAGLATGRRCSVVVPDTGSR